MAAAQINEVWKKENAQKSKYAFSPLGLFIFLAVFPSPGADRFGISESF